MIEGFFLDRVDVGGDDLPIDAGDELPFLVFADAADAELSRRNLTAMGTEEAIDLASFEAAPEHRLFDHPNSPDLI